MRTYYENMSLESARHRGVELLYVNIQSERSH